ncbi:unnamed protein product (macronuclear) [Paramecium tetraurelia]|uniref:Casein kinase I n=1 Tax=Paramecium tetraurelia TaxID=5888 RepID=A0E1I0_PARTE|nr:uncharacterized protein GSPATT00022316001 [Paramecium tetraurelia]CAK89147.1 unnamed protein product [Paramecium tetraurelia]|eukprot:XP_001456544.1 hypothetical protein (macronuclear) [Paramecium tetraurelia strain d4-2]
MDEAMGWKQKKLTAGMVIAGKYKLLEKIGAGSFGMVFKSQYLKNGDLVAAKFEKRDDSQKGVSLLIREIKVLSELQKGFPQIKFYGRDENYNFFMETYLGLNLEQLLRKCGNRFSIHTTLRIGIQIIERLQAFHEKNLIHRDIKPENFTISRQDATQIMAIDFGLAKYFRDTGGKHIPFVNNKGLIGTARYASINALQGNEQSRRDDIEAIAYVLIYFHLGELPWQNIQVASKEEKYKQILVLKQNNELEKYSDKIPKCLMKMLQIAKSYEFNQTPDYMGLTKLLQDELTTDAKMDWESLLETNIDKMSVSIDMIENDNQFDDLQDDKQQEVINSMNKIAQQETKFINGRLNNSRNHIIYLEVPKNSIVLNDAQSPAGTIKSFNTSKVNHYGGSHINLNTQKQFSDLRVKSCENFQYKDEDNYEADSDDQPCILYQNLVIGRSSSKM